MDKGGIHLEEQHILSNQKENISNTKNNRKIKLLNNNSKNTNNKINTINIINNKPQKRKRDHSPLMDIDEDEEENKIKHINKNYLNKKKKIPLTKLVERINLNDPEENDNKNNTNIKKDKKRGIKIFTDMSISEISNNLFKNYYPCVLPEYYKEQISQQIIDNQIEKLTSNFIKEKSNEIKNKKIKINQNMDYLRELAEKQGEWVEQGPAIDDRADEYDEDEQGYKSYDSNSENNSKNSYPEDESIIEEEEQEKDFDDQYDYYDNNNDEEY